MLTKTTLIAAPKAAVIRRDVSALKAALSGVSTAALAIQRELPTLDETMRKSAITDMASIESLRLQATMDRLAKLMSTLGDLMKKAAERQDAITQNLK